MNTDLGPAFLASWPRPWPTQEENCHPGKVLIYIYIYRVIIYITKRGQRPYKTILLHKTALGDQGASPTSCLLRPWLHILSLKARINAKDKAKHKWSSEGVTKISKKKDNTKNVFPGSNRAGLTPLNFSSGDSLLFRPTCLLRSGGPRLKETQSYPYGFCRHLVANHKKYCLESCQEASSNNVHACAACAMLIEQSCKIELEDTEQLPPFPDRHQISVQGPQHFVLWLR